MLERLRDERMAGRSLLMFDVEGRLRPRYRRRYIRPAPLRRSKPKEPRFQGAPPSELRLAIEGFLRGEGAGIGYLTAELAERYDVGTTQMADMLGNMKRRGTVRNVKVATNGSKRRWYGA